MQLLDCNLRNLIGATASSLAFGASLIDVSYIWDTLVVASDWRCGWGNVSFVAAEYLLTLDTVS